MTDLPLPAIERELLDLLHSLNLRMTVEKAGRIGELLEAAREQCKAHGEWKSWLARMGLNRKTAHDYLSVHRGIQTQAFVRRTGQMTITSFLRALRKLEHPAEPAMSSLRPATGGVEMYQCAAYCYWPEMEPLWIDSLEPIEWEPGALWDACRGKVPCDLPTIEVQLREMLASLNLRKTAEECAWIGELLWFARRHLEPGQ